MKHDQVPQENISTYAGHKKAIYALDEEGNYGVVPSSGWDVEEAATKQALEELERQADEAYEAVEAGEMSPLYYHMFAQRMDLQVLAESTGMFKWRIRRHFDPKRFAKLSEKVLARYGEALGLGIDELKTLPERGAHHD